MHNEETPAEILERCWAEFYQWQAAVEESQTLRERVRRRLDAVERRLNRRMRCGLDPAPWDLRWQALMDGMRALIERLESLHTEGASLAARVEAAAARLRGEHGRTQR